MGNIHEWDELIEYWMGLIYGEMLVEIYENICIYICGDAWSNLIIERFVKFISERQTLIIVEKHYYSLCKSDIMDIQWYLLDNNDELDDFIVKSKYYYLGNREGWKVLIFEDY